jgi:hypothetical protein
MWEPQPLTTLRASKACRGENFTFYYSGGSLKVTGLTIESSYTIQTIRTIVCSYYRVIFILLCVQWLLASPYVPLEDVTLPEPTASRSFVNLLHCLHVKIVLEASLICWRMGSQYHAGCHRMVSSSGSHIRHSSLPVLRMVRVKLDISYL